MKGSEAKKMADEALNQLAAALEEGKSESLTAYLRMVSLFPSYSLRNIALIAAQRPDALRVAGYNAWKKLGRFVMKGEKGIVIIAPMVIRDKGSHAGDEEPRLLFKAVRVFDVSQTDGEELPDMTEVGGDPGRYADRLKNLIARQGISLVREPLPYGTNGYSSGGKIAISDTLSPSEEFSTLVHELAHEMLHRNGERADKIRRETEAEAVAFIVCEAIGLETGTAARDYIHLYDGKAETLTESLERIRSTAASIIEGINEEPATQAAAA